MRESCCIKLRANSCLLRIRTEMLTIIMSPVGGDSSNLEAELIIDLGIWNRQTKLGFTFSSSTVFKLPNGANSSPDAAWIKWERWEALISCPVEQ